MKKIIRGKELFERMSLGIATIAEPVASTLGPAGKNVILYSEPARKTLITKDGATVARFIDSIDPTINYAIEVVKQACLATNTVAGDGTTTSVVFAKALFDRTRAFLEIHPDQNVNRLRATIEKITEKIVDELKKLARPVSSIEDIFHIASISSNDKEIGNLIANAVTQAGLDGAIIIEESRSNKTSLEVREGFVFDGGFYSSHFMNNERLATMNFEDPVFLVTSHRINKLAQIMPVLQASANQSRPLVIIADEVEGQALAGLILNVTKGTLKVAVVRAPKYGEERQGVLEDLALSVGANFIDASKGMPLETAKFSDLGAADKIESTRYMTVITGPRGESHAIESRKQMLRQTVEGCTDLHEAERVQERIIRLSSAVVIVKVGGLTEVDMIERKHRVEDALNAVKAAQADGVLPGGGVGILRAFLEIVLEGEEDQEEFRPFMFTVCVSPLLQLIKNSEESDGILATLLDSTEKETGYDFYSKTFVNMYDAGIIDPCKVVITALQNAVSAIGTLLTTNHVIIELD